MKVKELIKILKKHDQNLPVASSGADGCADWLYEVETEDVYISTEVVRPYDLPIKETIKTTKCVVVG